MKSLLLVVALLAASCAAPAKAPIATGERTIIVRITDVREAVGHVHAALWFSSETYLKDGRWSAALSVPAAVPVTCATFERVALGRYAISVFHDRTDAGALRRGVFGIPIDPWGFSAPSLLGPPSFERATFDVEAGAEPLVVEIVLVGGGPT